jgi:hypothetical protein
MIERNNISMLAHKFCIAPMMDWTETSRKTKRIQQLRVVPIARVVPNEVPTLPRSVLQRMNFGFVASSGAAACQGVLRQAVLRLPE